MKIIVALLSIWIISDFLTIDLTTSSWRFPIQYVTGINPMRLYAQRNSDAIQLSLIKENVYFPYRIFKGQDRYFGLMAVKPKENGQVEITGTLIKGNDFARMTMIRGQLIQKNNYYDIQFTESNASKLFSSKEKYTEHITFPMKLELRTHNDSTPYLTASLSELNLASFERLYSEDGIEQSLVGNFNASSDEGDWKFDLKKLGPSQITGVAYLQTKDTQCAYSIYGMDTGWDRITLLTGEDTQRQSQCPLFAWKTSSENTRNWEPLHDPNGDSLHLYGY